MTDKWMILAKGFTLSFFKPSSLTIITPDAPSQIWLDDAAVMTPPSASSLTP